MLDVAVSLMEMKVEAISTSIKAISPNERDSIFAPELFCKSAYQLQAIFCFSSAFNIRLIKNLRKEMPLAHG